jgi:hypothetical protein
VEKVSSMDRPANSIGPDGRATDEWVAWFDAVYHVPTPHERAIAGRVAKQSAVEEFGPTA